MSNRENKALLDWIFKKEFSDMIISNMTVSKKNLLCIGLKTRLICFHLAQSGLGAVLLKDSA
jgi:hypothetical protein